VSLVKVLQADWREGAAHWLGAWREVFAAKALPQDLLAAFTVAAVALPLNLALAVASGLPPAAGLVAGAVGGVVAATFGGTPMQVTGPAAALASMVAAVALGYGPVGVAAAALMVGVVQLVLALTRAGHLARLVPESVLAGFTTGVGLKLLDQQLPELLGFDYRVSELASMMHRPEWLHEVDWLAVVCGLFVALLVVATTRFKRFPAALVGIGIITFVSNYVGFKIARVGEVPREFLVPQLPVVGATQWLDLFIAVLPLAILASAESLLASNAIDRMVKASRPDAQHHHPSLELFGQGLANVAVGLLSGMPVSGVVVRSGVNVQSGARTRLASLLHALILGLAVVLVGDQIARTPLAALAGLLCVIGFRLLELSTFIDLVRNERLEAIAFAVTLVGTVTGHLTAGLVGGLVLHAVGRLWFHRGEAAERREISESIRPGTRAVLGAEHASARKPSPEGTGSAAHWLGHVRSQPVVPATAYVHPQASLIGHIILGENVHVAAGSSVRADEGAPFFIGPSSNVQDGVVIHALKDKKVIVGSESWAVYVGRNVSMAHDALIHGPCFIGDDTFIGFKAVVHDSVVGPRCFVGIGAVVVGVEIPEGKFVPHGTIVDSQSKVDALPGVDAAQRHFNEDVVDVNRGLAAAYRSLHAPTSTGVARTPRPEEPSEAWVSPSFERF
jgi:SulP family sulfate permease